MDYELEELVPVVGKLAEKYTANESTSLTYKKAEQLMGAVLYCIREAESFAQTSVVPLEGLPPQKAYEIGLAYVGEKVKKAWGLYQEILPQFSHYGNTCLNHILARGLPEFFKWYDIRMEPQNTILELGYPVLKDISRLSGVDKVYEFLLCVRLEQKFLGRFPCGYVTHTLSKYNREYKDMADNLCEVVFQSLIGRILTRKPISGPGLEEGDYLHMQEMLMGADRDTVLNLLKGSAITLAGKYYENCEGLSEYLTGAVDSIAIRLKNAAENGVLHQIL